MVIFLALIACEELKKQGINEGAARPLRARLACYVGAEECFAFFTGRRSATASTGRASWTCAASPTKTGLGVAARLRADRLRFAYQPNGLQSHRLEGRARLIADSGYAGVSITLDHMHLDPLGATPADTRRVKRALETRKPPLRRRDGQRASCSRLRASTGPTLTRARTPSAARSASTSSFDR